MIYRLLIKKAFDFILYYLCNQRIEKLTMLCKYFHSSRINKMFLVQMTRLSIDNKSAPKTHNKVKNCIS